MYSINQTIYEVNILSLNIKTHNLFVVFLQYHTINVYNFDFNIHSTYWKHKDKMKTT